jgi:hypothetical protein
MAEYGDKKAATPTELDDFELLGFEWLEPERGDRRKEHAIATAFNKIGLSGEGPVIKGREA